MPLNVNFQGYMYYRSSVCNRQLSKILLLNAGGLDF